MSIDLNADLGELPGTTGRELDAALLRIVTSANVATGGHAGDPDSMLRVCRQATRSGVTIGAHVSYPDRRNFGRQSMRLSPVDLRRTITEQLDELRAATETAGAAIAYVKPHGALYHDAGADDDLAELLVDVAARADVAVLTLPGKVLHASAVAAGVPVFSEGFADRAYRADGSLEPRDRPDAVIHDPDRVRDRVVALARREPIEALDGTLTLRVDSVCLHGDTPGAVSLAATVRNGLAAAGIDVRPFLVP